MRDLPRDAVECLIAALAISSVSYAQDNREQKPEASPPQQTQERAKPSIPVTVTTPVRVEREKEAEPDWDKLKCVPPGEAIAQGGVGAGRSLL